MLSAELNSHRVFQPYYGHPCFQPYHGIFCHIMVESTGVALTVPLASLQNGLFKHLGLSIEDGKLCIPSSVVIPPADMGRWSRTNVEGYELVRHDLPKTTKTISVEAPDWGDWSNGSHTVEWEREVYQRD